MTRKVITLCTAMVMRHEYTSMSSVVKMTSAAFLFAVVNGIFFLSDVLNTSEAINIADDNMVPIFPNAFVLLIYTASLCKRVNKALKFKTKKLSV